MPRFNPRLALALSTLALAAIPGTAFADGFDGPYAGADGGLAVLKVERDTVLGPSEDTDYSAAARGVIGYRMSIGSPAGPVVEVEGDVGGVTGDGDLHYGVSAIGGIQVAGSTMLYARAGYAWLDGIVRPGGDTIHGPVLGGGIETALAPHTHLRLDYRHVAYKDYDIPDNTAHFTGNEVTGGVIFGF